MDDDRSFFFIQLIAWLKFIKFLYFLHYYLQEKVEPVSANMSKYIWTVAELMRDKQTGSAVGRFEVNCVHLVII